MHFPLFSRSHWSSRRCHSAQHPNSEQSPKVKCLNGGDFEKFQGWRWRLDFFPYGKFLFAPNEEWSQGPSWCLGTLCQTSRKLTHRKLIVGYKRPKHQPVRNFKKLKDLSKFHSPNRMRTLVHFRFRGISRLPEVLSPAFLQICWEVPTRQLHILSNSPIHESQLKVACFPESFRSFRAKNLKPPFLVTSRLSQGFSRFVASASSNGIELEMMPENITCSSQKDWKSSTPGRFGRIRPMWLRPSQQRSIWDVSK